MLRILLCSLFCFLLIASPVLAEDQTPSPQPVASQGQVLGIFDNLFNFLNNLLGEKQVPEKITAVYQRSNPILSADSTASSTGTNVEKEERKFKPTDLGFAVNDFLVKYFPDIFDISFTAGMEDELDEIANGRLNLEKVLNNFYKPFKKKLDEAFSGAARVKLNLGETDEKCPECGHPLVIRMSKFGKFLACSNFPECKFTKNILEKAGIACPLCLGDIIVKKTRSGKQFYGCANYPQCRFAAWKKEDIK